MVDGIANRLAENRELRFVACHALQANGSCPHDDDHCTFIEWHENFVWCSIKHQHVTRGIRNADDVGSRIPKVYRFVWSGKDFPSLYGSAIESVFAADPDARIVVHCFGTRPESSVFDHAVSDSRVEVQDCEPSRLFGALPPHLRRVSVVYDALPPGAMSARSNLLRYALLYLHGGVYLDFDTITIKPLDDLVKADCFVGNERVWSLDEPRVAGDRAVLRTPRALAWLGIWFVKRLDAAVFSGRLRLADRTARLNERFTHLQPNNAVIGAAPRAEFLDRLLRAAHTVNPLVRYSTGPTLIAKVARSSPHLVTVLPTDVFYGVEPAESYRYFSDRTLRLHPQTAVIHYVGSNSKRFLKLAEAPRRSLIGRLVELVHDTNVVATAESTAPGSSRSSTVGVGPT